MDGTAYLGIGSNIGDRRGLLRRGLTLLSREGVRIVSTSPLYETDPMYVTDQAPFLNAAARIECDRAPLELLSLLSAIEAQLGRQRAIRFGPRTLDLDILLWGRDGQTLVRSPDLTVPHPRLIERAFVLAPLAEIAGDLVHPLADRTIAELSRQVGHDGVTRIESSGWYRPEIDSEYRGHTAS